MLFVGYVYWLNSVFVLLSFKCKINVIGDFVYFPLNFSKGNRKRWCREAWILLCASITARSEGFTMLQFSCLSIVLIIIKVSVASCLYFLNRLIFCSRLYLFARGTVVLEITTNFKQVASASVVWCQCGIYGCTGVRLRDLARERVLRKHYRSCIMAPGLALGAILRDQFGS